MPTQAFFIVTMHKVAVIIFELRISHAKMLVTRYFMIVSLFKNCAWLQKFYISIESFKWNMWMEVYHQLQTAITFANLISFIQIHVYKFKWLYKTLAEKDYIRTILFKRNKLFCVSRVLMVFIIYQYTVFLKYVNLYPPNLA